MNYDFAKVMAGRSNEELLKILMSPLGDYQPAALQAAKEEFEKRGLSAPKVEIIQNEILEEQSKIKAKAEEPLDTMWKVLSFLMPGMIPLIFSRSFASDGYDRKANEIVNWTVYGLGFYVMVTLLLSC
jgi:hypothetical protein